MSKRKDSGAATPVGRSKRVRLERFPSVSNTPVSASRLRSATPKVEQEDDDGDDDDDDEEEGERMDPAELLAEGTALLDGIEALEDDQGRIIDPFLRLPPKRQFPDYYEIIERPIAVDVIRRQLKKGEYRNMDALKADLALLVANAQQYNEKGSFLYVAADMIDEFVQGWGQEEEGEEAGDDDAEADKGEAEAEGGENDEEEGDDEQGEGEDDEDEGEDDGEDEEQDEDDEPTGEIDASGIVKSSKKWRIGPYPDDPDALPLPRNLKDGIQRIVAYLRAVRTEDGRKRALSLDDLPDRKAHPEYYAKAKQPIALGYIVEKSKKNPYKALERFGDDLGELYLNTINVFGKDSIIGQDAIALRTVSDRMLLETKVMLERPAQELSTPDGAMSPAAARGLRGLISDFGGASPLGPRVRLSVAGPMRRESGLRESTLPPELEQETEPEEPPKYVSPHQWRSSGAEPLIASMTIATTSLYSPAVLHIRGDVARPSQQMTWTLPNEAYALSCTAQLHPSLYTLSGVSSRNAELSIRVNGRIVAPTRKTIPILAKAPTGVEDWAPREVQHGIYDLRLSSGVNCVEAVVEADSQPAGERERERIAVIVHLS